MDPFIGLVGQAATLLEDDIDTDVIFPARYLLVVEKKGLGPYLFHDRRQGDTGEVFSLDRPAFAGANILIAGANFGCGSSREQAVWTLMGAGFRCVIASSFGDIFYNNCFKNGLLPVVLPAEDVTRLAALAETGIRFEVDLMEQTVKANGQLTLHFEIAPERRAALLSGHDDIDQILLTAEPDIEAFETRHRRAQPWLFASPQGAA